MAATSQVAWMDGWMGFISPGGTEPKGPWHAKYIRFLHFAVISSKPLHLPCATPPYASFLSCEQIDLEATFSKCLASYLQQLKRDLLVEAV